MIQILVILFCLAVVITEFFSAVWGWIILCIPIVFLVVTLLWLKQKKWHYIPELSESANQMLQKFGHYYAMPFAGRDFSASASTLAIAGGVIVIVGLFKGFWWGIGIGILNWFVMGMVSRAFNLSYFQVDYSEQKAHEEIISYIMGKIEKQKSDIMKEQRSKQSNT